eukprot:4224926-Prymnesium_polylepis.1
MPQLVVVTVSSLSAFPRSQRKSEERHEKRCILRRRRVPWKNHAPARAVTERPSAAAWRQLNPSTRTGQQ